MFKIGMAHTNDHTKAFVAIWSIEPHSHLQQLPQGSASSELELVK